MEPENEIFGFFFFMPVKEQSNKTPHRNSFCKLWFIGTAIWVGYWGVFNMCDLIWSPEDTRGKQVCYFPIFQIRKLRLRRLRWTVQRLQPVVSDALSSCSNPSPAAQEHDGHDDLSVCQVRRTERHERLHHMRVGNTAMCHMNRHEGRFIC